MFEDGRFLLLNSRLFRHKLSWYHCFSHTLLAVPKIWQF